MLSHTLNGLDAKTFLESETRGAPGRQGTMRVDALLGRAW